MIRCIKWLMPFICSWVVVATEWKPTDSFLRAVSFIESSNGRFTIGDNGNSLGEFQLSEAAWLDVSEWRKARRLNKTLIRSYIQFCVPFVNFL